MATEDRTHGGPPGEKPSRRKVTSVIKAHLASIVTVTGFLSACFLVAFLLGEAGILDLGFIYREWGTLWGPAWISLLLTILSFVIGLALATPLGLIRAYGPSMFRRDRLARRARAATSASDRVATNGAGNFVGRGRRVLLAPAYGLATGYVEAIRGTPFYVQMWIVFYLVSFAFPRLPSLYFIIGLVALTLSTVGYQAEILRAGFQSVGQGQIEAAKAIGMRGRQVFAHVTLPQGLRLVVLPLTNEWIGLFKTSSILNFVAIQELMFQGYDLGSNQGHPIEAFLMVAVMYCAILIPLGRAVTYLEQRKRIPGLGTQIESKRASVGRRSRTTF